MPSIELFNKQPVEYKKAVLGENVPILGVEAGSTQGWEKYTHYQMGIDTFGTSAPGSKVYEYFGLTAEGVAEKATKLIEFFANRAIPSKVEEFGF